MLVFWEHRLVILATPKTGTTAVLAALDSLAEVAIQQPPALKHTPMYRYRNFVEPWLRNSAKAEFTTVALMREPISWLGSWFRYRQRDDIPLPDNSTSGMSFDDFVTAYLTSPQPDFARVGSQARFLHDHQGNPVDMIFCYEQIEGFVDFLEERLNCEILLPLVNVSPEGDTRLSAATEARLREERAEDFALYARVAAGAGAAGTRS